MIEVLLVCLGFGLGAGVATAALLIGMNTRTSRWERERGRAAALLEACGQNATNAYNHLAKLRLKGLYSERAEFDRIEAHLGEIIVERSQAHE